MKNIKNILFIVIVVFLIFSFFQVGVFAKGLNPEIETIIKQKGGATDGDIFSKKCYPDEYITQKQCSGTVSFKGCYVTSEIEQLSSFIEGYDPNTSSVIYHSEVLYLIVNNQSKDVNKTFVDVYSCSDDRDNLKDSDSPTIDSSKVGSCYSSVVSDHTFKSSSWKFTRNSVSRTGAASCNVNRCNSISICEKKQDKVGDYYSCDEYSFTGDKTECTVEDKNDGETTVAVTTAKQTEKLPTIEDGHIGDDFCQDENVVKALQLVGIVLLIARVAVPLIIIIVAFKDLYAGVFKGDHDAVLGSWKKLLWRLAIGMIIFFIPNIVAVLLDGFLSDQYHDCSHCVFYPLTDCQATSSSKNTKNEKIKNCADAKTQSECPSSCKWGYNGLSTMNCYYDEKAVNTEIKNCADAETQSDCLSNSSCTWGYDNGSKASCYYKTSD